MLDEQLITRALFGGAIEMSLPQRFVDVSDYRPVPDHQEVHLSLASQHYPDTQRPLTYRAGVDGRHFGPIRHTGNSSKNRLFYWLC
jgi:hypothetical protein